MSDIQLIEVGANAVELIESASVIIESADIIPSDRIVPIDFDSWLLENGYYYVDISHYLESTDLFVSFRETAHEEVWVDRWEPYTSNKIRLYTPSEPDGRFAGKCLIRKMSGAM